MFNRSDTPTNNSNPATTNDTGTVTLEKANKVVTGMVSTWGGSNRANNFVIANTFADLPADKKEAAKQ
jgi:hypothetical protein